MAAGIELRTEEFRRRARERMNEVRHLQRGSNVAVRLSGRGMACARARISRASALVSPVS
jgi:hypothetical protein